MTSKQKELTKKIIESKESKPKLTLTLLLELSIPRPVDLVAFEKWDKNEQEKKSGEYPGWMLYGVKLDDVLVTVEAKRNPNGGYHIRNYILRNLL